MFDNNLPTVGVISVDFLEGGGGGKISLVNSLYAILKKSPYMSVI